MEQFIQKYRDDVTGVLSGFDRLMIRGTLRTLMYTAGIMGFLNHISILAKDFMAYAEETTEKLKQASLAQAERLGRRIEPIRNGKTDKEVKARKIAAQDGITEGLICILKAQEVSISYDINKIPGTDERTLTPRYRMCQHLYHYFIDPEFGFMNARIQTWFPFAIQICLNGREWLARQMDKRTMRYERHDNCFAWLENNENAQSLMDSLVGTKWGKFLHGISRKLNPLHDEIFEGTFNDYYWSVQQSEWATDIMFRSRGVLDSIAPQLARGAISTFSSQDVMRFLGRKLSGNFMGEVTSSYKERREGVRVKHNVKANSLKGYSKQGTVFRVETTINQPDEFRVFRRPEGKPKAKPRMLPVRKGFADIKTRAQLCQDANERYLEALAALDTDSPLSKIVGPVCQRVRWKRQSIRGLRPWTSQDTELLKAISRGEFAINGFQNRDILLQLHPGLRPGKDRKRKASAITRKFRMLRAHRIIRKVPHTHRYKITSRGREVLAAILQSHDVTLKQLNEAAA